MGQVIRFPLVLDAYPAQSVGLNDAEAVLLVGVRWWAEDVRNGIDPTTRLRHGFAIAGAPEAALALDALMTVAGQTARRQLEIHGARCDCLSPDETHLLHAASLAQAGDSPRAEAVLRTTLLTAQGADMALGPLQGIGRLLSAARLLLPRRLAPESAAAPATLH